MTAPRQHRTIVAAALLAVASLLAACSAPGEPATPMAPPTSEAQPTATSPAPSPTPPPPPTPTPAGTQVQAGTLEVRITDAPDPEVTSVLVTVTGVEVHRADPGEWRTVVEGPASFDLIALTGVEAILGARPLEAGRYTQVRLEIDTIEVTRAGETEEAEVPSGTLKLVGAFLLEPAETTIITLDFDVDRSLVQRVGKPPLFKPVVKLIIGEPGAPGKPTVPLTGAPPTPAPSPVTTEAPPPTATALPETATPTATTAPAETATPAATITPTEAPTAAPPESPAPTPTQDPTGALFLAIESPADLVEIVTEDTVEITGRTRIDALVSVNDEIVDVDENGRFSATVALEEGDNVIEIVASIATGEEVGESLVIFYEPTGS